MSDVPSDPSAVGNASAKSATSSIAGKAVESSPGEPRTSRPPLTAYCKWVLWLFGILLPAITIAFEITFHACAETFFDPIPTWWQLGLITLVPVANFATWFALVKRRSAWLPRLAHLNGCAIGVSLIYAVLFLPLTPFSLIGVIFGLGLLALSPLLSFWASVTARGALVRGIGTGAALPKIWIGFAAGILALALPEAHDFLTQRLLAMAASKDVTQSSRGVALLRTLGSRDSLLRACYVTRDWTVFLGGITGIRQSGGVTTEEAAVIYYRVTGDPHNSVPVPVSLALPGRRSRGMWNFDAALGGTKVASKVPGLSMTSSLLDGKVEATAATSYIEWTMVFKNIAMSQSEARAQIELPPGGVVSRLTLWIDSEPREAAFGGRSQVRAAYQEVAVQQSRDPVLVTTCGPDRVLMQCFPVPPNGGEMKVRVGITAPLRLDGDRRGAVLLPRFLETNFEQEKDFTHDVWIESDQPLDGAGPTAKLSLREGELQAARSLAVALPVEAGEQWTADPNDSGFVIRQTVRRSAAGVPSRAVFVIDGSKSMASEIGGIAEALCKMPAGRDFAVVFAGDEPAVLETGRDTARAAAWLRARKATGGCDNLPALERAWDLAAAEPGGAVVWLHGPQPVLVSRADRLLQRTERERNPPLLYDLTMGVGPNRIAEELDRFRGIRPLRQGGNLVANLDHLLSLWRGDTAELSLVRDRVPRSEVATAPVADRRHIARLWGLGEIERLAMSSEQGGMDRAIKLALQLQLVTRVSGAVVLERKEQYDRAGLTAVDPSTVPTIPEPGSVVLVLLGGGVLLMRRCRRSSPNGSMRPGVTKS